MSIVEQELKLVPIGDTLRELQAKFAINSDTNVDLARTKADLFKFFGLAQFQIDSVGDMSITDRYFDDVSLSLLRDGCLLRVRTMGSSSYELTIKTPRGHMAHGLIRSEGGGQMSWSEIERHLEDGFVEFSQPYLEGRDIGELKEVLVVHNLRFKFTLVREKEEYECAIDRYVFTTPDGGLSTPTQFEIEIESKSDEATASLPELGDYLFSNGNYEENSESKYQRGAKLLGLTPEKQNVVQYLRQLQPTWIKIIIAAIAALTGVVTLIMRTLGYF